MKRFAWILLLAFAAPCAWPDANKKMTVEELSDLLASFQHSKKSDEETATQLKQIELTDQLTVARMNAMAPLVPGPLSTEQMYVLEARSSMLAPPASDLPTAPAPDPAAQQAMLSKAQEYVSRTYDKLPHLTAKKMTARFQDGVEAVPTYGGMHTGINFNNDPIFNQASLYVRLMNSYNSQIESDNGIERTGQDKTPWGTNGIIASVGPPLSLNTAMHEIMSNGNPRWLRWETINDHQVAVYSFDVEKKKTRYTVNYCCFPNTDTTGSLNYSLATPSSSGHVGTGNMQNSVDWKNFKATGGYHGRLFVDPDTGIVVRLITEADFKPTDFVHKEAVRTDYAPMTISGKTLIVPIRSFNIAETVPNGDANAAHVTIRHQFVTQDYKDYQLDHGAFGSSDLAEAKPLVVDSAANKLVKELNADVLAARAANKDKHYADAEAIILKDTVANPDIITPWIELGLAQLGLGKYADAEATFKTALAINPSALKSQKDTGFQKADDPQTTHVTRHVTPGSGIANGQTRTPEMTGLIYSSLGDIYIHTNRIPEAQAAYDTAAQAFPAKAAFYLRNETIFFYQLHNTDAQLASAEKAIGIDPSMAMLYFFKGQALAAKASVDDKTQKLVLPPGCLDAFTRYLQLEPSGQFAETVNSILTSAGIDPNSAAKLGKS
jgi:tetratricopeptide (TPR) repeat protein